MAGSREARRRVDAPILPDDLAAERAILGALLLGYVTIQANEIELLRPDDFALDADRKIYRAMLQLMNEGIPIDSITLAKELENKHEVEAIGGITYLSSLIDSVVERPSIKHYVRTVRNTALLRRVIHTADALAGRAAAPGADPAIIAREICQFAESLEQDVSSSSESIRSFEDIPDLLRQDAEPIEFLVDGLVARKTITQWAGTDGTAKTFLAQRMGVEVATGKRFLGRQCRQSAVIYLDYENANFAVRERLESMIGEDEALPPNFRVWGTWLVQQPPQIGSDLLLQLAKQVRPLLIIDPFRYSHDADENDSAQMMVVMRHLRTYAAAGAAVVILHHPAKAEGSTGRGSTAIRGAADISVMQELSEETGLITLRWVKNRFGEKPCVTIRPDFNAGTFEVTDSPAFVRRSERIRALRKHIEAKPGQSKNQLCGLMGGNRTEVLRLLKECARLEWKSEPGPRNSTLYFPLVPEKAEPVGTSGTSGDDSTGSTGSPPYKGEPVGNQSSPTHSTGTNGKYHCYVHPKNETNWWLRGGTDPVCGLCHPSPTSMVETISTRSKP
jgi:hypothetical protein